jgi:hypothetical protein
MLDIAFSIHGPAGWIDLEDPEGGYEAHKDTRATQAISWRKQEISSAYVEGTFVNDAVKENVVEALAIYVQGTTQFELSQRVQALTDALSQLQYEIKARYGNAEETWTCSVADITLEFGQELVSETMMLVRAQVPRLPHAILQEV